MQNVNKILIVGSAGSGKTTFAKELSSIINLPVIHLDKEYWKPNWEKPDHDEWVNKLDILLNKDKWIIDGNYRSTLKHRLEKADMIIFLDYSRKVCINGVLSRIDKYEGKVRDDLSEGCIETFDPEFLKWVWDFPEKYRPEIIETLKNTDKLVVILKNRQQAKKYLSNLKNINE